MTQRYFIEFSFKGTKYHGWQTQPNALTIQQIMEEALTNILGSKISLTGAGRTDTGVHASYYVAHFDHNKLKNRVNLSYKLNRYLSKDISIFRIIEAPGEAHARFNALNRTYKYVILKKKHSFLYDYAFIYEKNLDTGLMNIAAELLLQTTDFSSFAKLHSDNKTNICNVKTAQWEEKGNYLVFTITADRFLRNMVRSLTSTLLDVGKSKISPVQFKEIIDSRNNQRASASAPAQGLFLYDIQYPEEFVLTNPVRGRFLPFDF